MTTTAEKTTKPLVTVQQKTVQAGLFRKAADEPFFGDHKSATFFGARVQPKLSVSQPDDPLEKEADHVADRVMRMPEPAAVPPVAAKPEEKLQRKEDEEVQAKLEVSTPKIQCKAEPPVIEKLQRKEDEELQAKLEVSTAKMAQGGVIEKLQRKEDEELQAKLEVSTSKMPEPPVDEKLQRKEDEELQPKAEEHNAKIQRKAEPEVSAAIHLNSPGSRVADSPASGIPPQARNISPQKNSRLFRSVIMRQSERGPPAGSVSFEQNLSSSKGAGTALPGETRNSMEGRFNADFSSVRVHTGVQAEQMSSQINAQAFTHGHDIYFNSGKFAPGTSTGNTLLAHELTHTIQQGASPAHSAVTRKISVQRASIAGIEGIDLSNVSGGSSLPGEAREYFQNSFRASVDDIRVHNDVQSLIVCRQRSVRAFAHGKHIFFDPSAYSPDSEEGGTLLAKQVADSLKQRSISVPGLESQLSAGIADVKKGDPPPKPQPREAKNLADNKEKKKAGPKGKTEAGGKGKSGAARGKKKKGKGSDEGRQIKVKKKDPKKAPASPEEDPAFHKAAKKTQATAKKEKVHDPAESKASAAQKSAAAVPKEAESKAQNRKTDGMDSAGEKDKPFDAEGFKADLLKKIESITPSTLKEATQFKENNKIDKVKTAMGMKVAQEKETSTGPVNQATLQPLAVTEADNKQPVPLPPVPKPGKPMGPSAKDAAPKPKLPNEISLQEQSKSLDDEMKANNVTEDQLVKSNESSFTSALDAKKGAQKDAVDRPVQYKKQETLMLKEAQSSANEESSRSMAGIQVAKGKNDANVGAHQQTAKQKDEESRAKVAKTIEDLYQAAETKVKTALDAADTEANKIFDEGSEAARLEFENYVDVKMRAYKEDRYSGFWGGLRWAKDKLFGMPDAVNAFYTDGRKLYLDKMDKVITQVATTVTQKLNDAKRAIKEGKTAIDNYVKSLPKELEEVGKEASSNIQDKFDTLEQSINDKRDQLIDGLAKKYVDNVKKLDDRISEMKEANKGLVDKAIGFLKKVWAVIKSLKDLFTTILSKLAAIIGTILSSPSGFFSNLGKAFKQGFDNFKNNFLGYLEQGLMQWLTTNLGIAGIELPDKFTPGALFTLALGVMGITKAHIRERAVAVLDEEKVSLLESAGGIIHKVYTEGVGSIWDMIVEKLSDFKEIIWEAIKSFIKKSIIDAALIFLLSLLSPLGAFIKVCMAIYDFLMMLVKFKDRIVELLDTILNAVTSIASGAIDGAAKAIEGAFAKSIPIIIGFLAALLHLNNITAKIKDIILRIQKRVEKALDWVILKGWAAIGKGVEGVLRIKQKGKEMVEKGKAVVVGAGKKVIGAVAGWMGMRKQFTLANGERHEIYFAGSQLKPEIIVASDKPKGLLDLIADRRKDPPPLTPAQNGYLSDAIVKKNQLDDFIAANANVAPGGGTATSNLEPAINARLDLIRADLVNGNAIPISSPLPLSNITYLMSSGRASKVKAEPLTRLAGNTTGSPPPDKDDTVPPGWLHIRAVEGRPITGWVKAHMVNENLHGPGVGWNLVPGSQRFNSAMKVGAEKWAKDQVEAGEIIYYEAEVSGWYHRDLPAASNYFPSGVTVTYGYMPDPSKNRATKLFVDSKHYTNDDPLSMGPPNINYMTRDDIKAMFTGIPNSVKIFDTRNSLSGGVFKSLVSMYFALKEAWANKPEFERTYWPLISDKFNHENAFKF